MDLRALRLTCGFDRKNKFALHADITRQYLDELENGTAKPSLDVANRVANALGRTLDEVAQAIFTSQAKQKEVA